MAHVVLVDLWLHCLQLVLVVQLDLADLVVLVVRLVLVDPWPLVIQLHQQD